MIRIFLFDQRLPCALDPVRFGEAEARRIEAIKNPKRRLESLCALAALDELIKISQMEFPLIILRDKNGKPYFESSDIPFSLSHSGDVSVAAICDEKDNLIGVDVEKSVERSNFAELVERFFSSSEKLEFLKSKSTSKAFFEIWTKKEAHAKMTGKGLSELLKGSTSPYNKIAICATDKCYEFYNDSGQYILSICSTRQEFNVEFYNNFANIKIEPQETKGVKK